jgi:hypothetical protein
MEAATAAASRLQILRIGITMKKKTSSEIAA